MELGGIDGDLAGAVEEEVGGGGDWGALFGVGGVFRGEMGDGERVGIDEEIVGDALGGVEGAFGGAIFFGGGGREDLDHERGRAFDEVIGFWAADDEQVGADDGVLIDMPIDFVGEMAIVAGFVLLKLGFERSNEACSHPLVAIFR